MNQVDNTTAKWARYFENQKNLWCDSSIDIHVKSIIRLVEVHRSDSKGWSLSVRKISNCLHLSPNTVMSAINLALAMGWLETNNQIQRKRRKLRLSVSLRAPVEHKIVNSSNLCQWDEQIDTVAKTTVVSPTEPVNNQGNNQANTEESQKERTTGTEPESQPSKENTQTAEKYNKIRESFSWLKKN